MDRYYDVISESYVTLYREEQEAKFALIRQFLKIRPDCLMLDIGCGPHFSPFPCRAVGVDNSRKLLGYAKITRVLADAHRLPFKSCSFDIVISVSALQNFSDPHAALLEAARVGRNQFAFTYPRKSPRNMLLAAMISQIFRVTRKIDGTKDMVFIAFRSPCGC